MALPTILINVTGGSDTQASGAGPATALFGTTDASTDGAGTTVTLTAGTDLSGVATDGSHVIYLADTTAGHRRFAKITGSAGSGGATPTVTVAEAFTINLTTKSWAIGGKRASIGSASSSLLIENNGASGDAMPGWIMEMESAHTETIAATINPRRAGDATSGPITLRGASGAGTVPIVTFSNNGDSWAVRAAQWIFRDFTMKNSAGTRTSASAFDGNSLNLQLIGMRCDAASPLNYNMFLTTFGSPNGWVVRDCMIGNTISHGINIANGISQPCRIESNTIYSCGGNGILYAGTSVNHLSIIGNVIAFNTTDGIHINDVTAGAYLNIVGNVIHGNGSDGLEVAMTAAHWSTSSQVYIKNNRFTLNGTNGINFSGASFADANISGSASEILGNNFFGNTSGKYAGITITSSLYETTTDPSGGAASATKDYAGATTGTNFMNVADKATGYPLGGTLHVGTNSSSYNYRDIGLQHQDSGGTASMSRPVPQSGGLV